MNEKLIDVLVQAAIVLIPLVAAVIAYWLRGYLKTLQDEVVIRIGQRNFDILVQFTGHAVNAAEQITGLDTGEKKKRYVSRVLLQFANDNGIQTSAQQMDTLIEGIVHSLKESPFWLQEQSIIED